MDLPNIYLIFTTECVQDRTGELVEMVYDLFFIQNFSYNKIKAYLTEVWLERVFTFLRNHIINEILPTIKLYLFIFKHI